MIERHYLKDPSVLEVRAVFSYEADIEIPGYQIALTAIQRNSPLLEDEISPTIPILIAPSPKRDWRKRYEARAVLDMCEKALIEKVKPTIWKSLLNKKSFI